MSAVYLYDDARARTFEPFALTRPTGELRAGALLLRERWARALNAPVAGHITSAHLAGFEEPGAAPVLADAVVPVGAWIVNARFAPSLTGVPRGDVLLADNRVAAIRVSVPVEAAALRDGAVTLDDIAARFPRRTSAAPGWWLEHVWDFIDRLVPMLDADVRALGSGMSDATPAGAIRIGEHAVFVEPGAIVEPQVCFDVSAGPIMLRARSHVNAFTRLVGPLYVGEGSTLSADRIAASSIGDVCKVHGEVSNTIFVGHANKGHEGFVGHSILGRWVNLGAGTTTSNLKNTYGHVQLWTPSGVQDTGMQFLGTLFGDHAKTGIGLQLTTGTVLGACANVYGTVMPPKVVAPFSWGEADTFETFHPEKFLEVATRMMARRQVVMADGMRAQLLTAYEKRWRSQP